MVKPAPSEPDAREAVPARLPPRERASRGRHTSRVGTSGHRLPRISRASRRRGNAWWMHAAHWRPAAPTTRASCWNRRRCNSCSGRSSHPEDASASKRRGRSGCRGAQHARAPVTCSTRSAGINLAGGPGGPGSDVRSRAPTACRRIPQPQRLTATTIYNSR